MDDSLPAPVPDDARQPDNPPAETMPKSEDSTGEISLEKNSPVESSTEEIETEEEEIEVPPDPVAMAADRAGFKFLAIGFVIFFVLIAICASIVALVMKNMGI